MDFTVTGVGVLDKAMSIVDAVEFQSRTTTEVAELLGRSLSTTHRLAMALVAHGMLARDAEGRLSPGARFSASTLALTSRPILDRLRERTSETAQLWVRRGDSRICLESSDAPHELRVILAPGSALPLAEGGSASLALLGEERQPASAGPGWVESMSHRTVGLGSVSAPVIIDGEIVAAICVAAPLPRIPVSPGHAWGSMVSEAAESLSRLRSR